MTARIIGGILGFLFGIAIAKGSALTFFYGVGPHSIFTALIGFFIAPEMIRQFRTFIQTYIKGRSFK